MKICPSDKILTKGGFGACGSSSSSSRCTNCQIPGDLSKVNNTFDPNSMPTGKLSKSNILDKLHLKLNQLNKLNAHVQKCNDALENPKSKCYASSIQLKSKMEFENFLRETYDESRYSYCILKCGPSVPHRQLQAVQLKNNRIPRNMGWNWKLTHAENWQPGALPKVIKMRMSHFLNYYPCDTLPITRLNIKLSKTSFQDCSNRESKIKKIIQSMGFSPCTCNKSVAWCMCRNKSEMTKLKNILEQIEKQIGESGLEYKLYLNEMGKENGKKMALFDKRTKPIPDLINQETQYEPMDFKILKGAALKASTDRLSRQRNIATATAKPNNSIVTVPENNSKGSNKK